MRAGSAVHRMNRSPLCRDRHRSPAIFGQVDPLLAAGAELVCCHAQGFLLDWFKEKYPHVPAVDGSPAHPGRRDHPAHRLRRHPERARRPRHRGDAPRQGFHGRQAGRHHVRAARRGAQGSGRDQAHLFDLLFGAFRDALDGEGGRTGPCRRHRPRHPDDGARAAPPQRRRGRNGFFSARNTAAFSPTSDRTSASNSCFSPEPTTPRLSPRPSPIAPIRTRRACRISAKCCCATKTAGGYIQVHWFTPDGLPTWGDGRLFIVGTEGTHRAAQICRHRRRAGDRPSHPDRRQGRSTHRLFGGATAL